MAFFKYFLPYTVGVLAIIYIQSDFARAAETCYFCNDSVNASSCSVNELDNSTQNSINKCNTTNDGLCGGISYTFNDTTHVWRGCNVNCSSLSAFLPDVDNYTNIICQSCSDNLCNSFEISGASSSIGISIVSVLSAMVALYSL